MRRYISILIVAISIAVTSCSNFLVKEESTPPEGAFVTLAVGKTGSRTILPESYDEVSALKNFVFTATSEDHEPITQTFADYDSLQTAKVPIVAGTWDFSLSATSQHGVQYKGALDNKIIVVGSNNLSFDIQIAELSAETGALEVQLTFPGTSVTVVKAGLYSIAGEALAGFPEDVLAISGGSTVTYSKDRVPGGSYVIQFSFYGDAECTVFLGMHTESVVIVSGKKSTATRSIESINPMYTITYELDGGSFVEGYTAPEKFTSGMEFQLPKVSKVRKSGMSFFGWYTDAAFTGSPVYSLPRGTCESKVYYAKWGTFTAETIDVIDLGSVAGDYDLVVSGPVTSETISTLKRKLTFAGTSAKIHLDLSQTTGLTSIDNGAFEGSSELTSVEIPAGVTSIGNGAFGGCSGLTSVTFGAGSQLESIGSSAFEGSSELTSVEIPASVTSIGSEAFRGCSGLTSVTFGEGSQLESIGSYAFEGSSGLTSVEIPAGVTSIGSWAFYGCSGLASVTFGEGSQLESIYGLAFGGCKGLTSVEIPASVTSIDESAFGGCSGLTSVTFGAGSQLESIGSCAFQGCSGLTSVEIPAGLTSIGYDAFAGCKGLTSVYYQGDLARWCEGFAGRGSLMALCENLYINGELVQGDLVIPAGVTSIGSSAFVGCSGLTSVTFEADSQLTNIGGSAFEGCRGLTSVEIPAGVTSIGSSAFVECSGLTSVTFEAGSQLTNIGGSAFQGCRGLTSVEIPAGVTSIGKWAFQGCIILSSVTFGDTSGWYVTTSETGAENKNGGTAVTPSPTDLAANEVLVRRTYTYYYWYKK